MKGRSRAVGEVLEFTDRDARSALEEIIRRRPEAVTLERQFAATPRGAALINRIKSDPALDNCELRVISHDGEYERVVPRQAPVRPPAAEPVPDSVQLAEAPAAQPLDQRGTRRAPRFKIVGDVSVQLDGNSARLVDLSTVGAQVVSSIILKPNQRVRVVLTDEGGALRFNAAIAWAFFEIPPNAGPQYRAGVNFIDANGDGVDAFCQRHRA
jgi:hypothetical protein